MERENSSMNAWTSIVGAYKMVHVLLSQELAEIGLTFPQYRVIRALGRSGAMPMNKIGEHMFVTPANITGLVDRLEGRGYVERKGVGTDRRVVRIGLTRKGKSSYQRTSVQHRRLISKIMGVLNKDELLNLTGQLQKVKETAIAERNTLRSADDTAQKSR
jgi:DNA-binding MarR family transcriptional regulator